MDISLNLKNVVKIVIEESKNSYIEYGLKNGVINSVETYKVSENGKRILSDGEMIDAIRRSNFMEELEDARQKYKLSREIDETFPEKDDSGNIKTPNRKISKDSLGIIQEIIKKDLDGTLDEIAQRRRDEINFRINNHTYEDEKQFELDKCDRNIKTIERSMLDLIKKNHAKKDFLKSKELADIIDDYNCYCEKRKELDDEIWKLKKEVKK